MFGRGFRSLIVVATITVASLAATQPAVAIELGHTGTVGAHSLTDTSANPGAIGKYRYYASDEQGWLVRLYVNPPKMRAVAGNSSQTVGWQYIVERKLYYAGFTGPWVVRFTSQEFTANTSDTHNAAFSQASASVTVPCGHNCEVGAAARYRITVKMIWHRANGTIQGTARNRIYWYGAQMTNGTSGVQEKTAAGSWSPDW